MEIKFKTEIHNDYNSQLSIEKTESGIFVTTSTIQGGLEVEESTHFLSKEDLKDFIGALLHVQSKLRNE
jgi:hypothetical protein